VNEGEEIQDLSRRVIVPTTVQQILRDPTGAKRGVQPSSLGHGSSEPLGFNGLNSVQWDQSIGKQLESSHVCPVAFVCNKVQNSLAARNSEQS
jgi:hypothetical protein